jgi:hypothetical protein
MRSKFNSSYYRLGIAKPVKWKWVGKEVFHLMMMSTAIIIEHWRYATNIEKLKNLKKIMSAPMPLWPPQIPHGLAWNQTWAPTDRKMDRF